MTVQYSVAETLKKLKFRRDENDASQLYGLKVLIVIL